VLQWVHCSKCLQISTNNKLVTSQNAKHRQDNTVRHLQTNTRLPDQRAASCFAGKLYLNATGWSQAVLGMIGQCRTDTSAPFSIMKYSLAALSTCLSFIHLAVHKGVLSLWIVQLQTEHQCSSLHSQLLHLSIDWAILGVRQLHHTCNILAGVSGVRPLSCGVAASGWTCPHLRHDE